MLRIYRVLLVVLLSMAVFASAATEQRAKPRKRPAKTAQPQPESAPAPAPQPPPPPPTPEQGPSSPPEVSFQGGQLTIVARNSTLGDVLTAVRKKTGAAVDMPAVSSERVVGRFGPGAPRDVMAQLLNGSHYDYVLLGSPADPGALKKVVLMARVSGPQAPSSAQPSQPNQPNPNLQAVPEVENDQNTEENNSEPSPDVEPQQEESQPEQPQPEQPQPGQNGPVVKTPEQLLRELQQQQQQQQQEQSAPPKGTRSVGLRISEFHLTT